MDNTSIEAQTIQAKTGFNYYKLQAAACITASSALSIGLIYWVIKTFG
jgi:hypothetical protein